jgi:hypothetical protein
MSCLVNQYFLKNVHRWPSLSVVDNPNVYELEPALMCLCCARFACCLHLDLPETCMSAYWKSIKPWGGPPAMGPNYIIESYFVQGSASAVIGTGCCRWLKSTFNFTRYLFGTIF